MNQLQAMRVFTRVVELSSFSLAARQLGMSAAAVTRSVGMLEAHLNMRLLNRTTRSLSLTESGREYLDGCRTIIEKLDEIESNLAQANRDPRGTLRIAASETSVAAGLGTLLSTYRLEHPRVRFDVTTFDLQVDMVEGGYDVCFCDDHRLVNSTFVSRMLTSVHEMVVASPEYLERHGLPTEPVELNTHSLLTVSNGAARNWEFSDVDGSCRVFTGNALTSTSSAMVRLAALNHMGIAQLPHPLVADDLARGTLLPILERYAVNGGPRCVSILYPSRNYLSTKVRSFIDYVVDHYRAPNRTAMRLAAA
ncbi:LysR family transcriptional regulator [Burkholderia sp. Ac-20344]|uniref:LysR family transcriptional regulator n=1 Tax=Burkholderia sp. Ac-20344 TaxID=2703890 RepID=UPI00197CA0A6|nr:LysR family transcriptional regulator [Burkholderia sp. Ac-20344]MBN3833958.1 LysR family transcriptional regulator [Burkholderia sp. Ac-20344]